MRIYEPGSAFSSPEATNMGLDVSSYSKLELVHTGGMTDEDEEEERVWLCITYPERADELVEGVYEVLGDRFSFRAGSYSAYNWWRTHLAALVGTTPRQVWDLKHEPPAFLEIIDFTDCDGVIGPKTAGKLAKDFEAWRSRAVSFGKTIEDNGEYFIEVYDEFAKAFKLASDGGAVEFA
jgi:hypothetical protein